jgi:hypothetical protein
MVHWVAAVGVKKLQERHTSKAGAQVTMRSVNKHIAASNPDSRIQFSQAYTTSCALRQLALQQAPSTAATMKPALNRTRLLRLYDDLYAERTCCVDSGDL